jgi:hypothetical protein
MEKEHELKLIFNFMTKYILKTALLNSVATAVYVSIIGSFPFFAGRMNIVEKTPLIPIFMLMLFVFSAALTGTLVFGRSILWYLDGKKQEALSLLACTLGIIFIFIMLAFAGLLLIKN